MSKKNVLIVEDDKNSRDGLKAILGMYGYNADTSKDGLQAIQKIKEKLFEVAVVDINLPPVLNVEINGWDLIRIFRSFNPNIDIIVVSGEKGIQSRAQSFNLAGCLEKPIRPSHLKSLMEALDEGIGSS
ncbi:MAG: response regulator [Nitrospirales bacterium]|nr:response regulator [Nitrospirales bacterium]